MRGIRTLFASPLIKRIVWHVRRVRHQLDGNFFGSLGLAAIGIVAACSVLVTLLERDASPKAFGESFYWGITTVMGQGDASYVTSPGGWLVSWLLVLFGVGIVATITGALLGFVIDFLLKEGQGMGASGYEGHIVVCGWNSTARELVDELRSDDYRAKVVVLHDAERSPAGEGVYYVRGDITNTDDLKRAGIEQATSAIVCPASPGDDADMRSILVVLAVESIAPQVRTVVEVNNPAHVSHLRRAEVDEVLVTSRLTSRLLARSAMYPGLSELVTDIVSGGEGSELYRVGLPDDSAALTVDQLSVRLRHDHHATLVAVARNGHTFVNPPTDFGLEAGDTLVVLAESLKALEPLTPA